MPNNNYLRNIDISKQFNISKPTVTRWFELAKEGKNNLQLEFFNKILRISKNEHNELELARLSKNAIQYKHTSLKKVTVKNSFFGLFEYEEQIEIINNLRYDKMIKEKYFYKKAELWDNFYYTDNSTFKKVVAELKNDLISNVEFYIDSKNINIVDIGIGNSMPAIGIIKDLQKHKTIDKYIGIDISPQMIAIAKDNITKNFPNLNTTFNQSDIETNILAKYFTEEIGISEDNPSLIMLTGGTICNMEDRDLVYKHIASPLKKSDLFVLHFTLLSEKTKNDINYMKNDEFIYDGGWPLELMGVDIRECEVMVEYNSKGYKDQYYILDKDYNITIKHKKIDIIIELLKGEKISVWRHYPFTIETFLQETKVAGLNVKSIKVDRSGKYAMAICKRAS